MDKTQDFFKPCILCNLENPENGHFWEIHHLSQKEYYHNYYPRFNLLTGEKLNFKTKEQYFLQDFDNRTELQNWIKKHNEQEIFDYLCDYLERRKTIKGITNFPCHFESKTLIFPSVLFIIKKFGVNFLYRLAAKTKLNIKYDYSLGLEYNKINNNLHYLIDSREKLILNLPNKKIIKLNYGDYTINNSDIFIERKSINDFCSTLNGGFERFCKELDRCQSNNHYLIILIEEKFNNLCSLKDLPHTRHIKATNDFLFHQAREILSKYSNCQIVCVDGRVNAVNFIQRIFSSSMNIKNLDLQYIIDNEC